MLLRNLGITELVLILALAVFVFGPGRIVELGADLGKGIRGFKEGLQGEDNGSIVETEDL
ncbi:MAG: twin-arginine translocase TatA/TatE family subunit [Anaerolineae bacterium]|nr:twin-arginine translocase TatA/TatE family subunit [Anaerolineae bacterium]